MAWHAVLIGSGNVGMLYDPPEPDDGCWPQSHALAITRHPEFELASVVDSDEARRQEARGRFPDCPVHADTEAAFTETRPDLVVRATPTDQRLPVVEAALAGGARHIFCEKPLAASAAEAESIAAVCREADAGLTVNYSRRWSRSIATAQTRVASDAYGPLRLITGYYRGALANNGAHLLDLALWFGGDLALADRFESGDTHAPHLFLRGEGDLQVWLHPLQEQGLDLFELDLICAGGRVRLTDGGTRVAMQDSELGDIGAAQYRLPTTSEHLNEDGAEMLWCAYEGLASAFGCWTDTPALRDAIRVSFLIEKAADISAAGFSQGHRPWNACPK